MPWKKEEPVEKQRARFVLERSRGEESMAESCRRIGISRRVGYKWLERYEQNGPQALVDQPKDAKRHPNRIADAVVKKVIELRSEHPLWGAPKLRQVFGERFPEWRCPSQTAIGDILREAGLTSEAKRRKRTPPHTQPLAHAKQSNDVLSIDFKGWFECGDGERVDPLTIIDNYSRYVLCCQAVDGCDYAHVRAVLERVFRNYGLPRAIRSDNGPPFATRALGGLSRLSVWWIKLGIEVERIPPGKPSKNGRQERFHRTLKLHTANPPACNRRAQQRAFRRFCREYNEERPHQALGQRTPASVYEPSSRRYPRSLLEMEYRSDWAVRKVHASGSLDWAGKEYYVGKVLAGERVGLEEVEEQVYRVWFGRLELGLLRTRRGKIAPVPLRRGTGPCGAGTATQSERSQS